MLEKIEDFVEEYGCCGIVAIIGAIALYIGVLYLFFRYAFIYVLFIAALIMAVWILVNFSKACARCMKRELPGAADIKPTGSQPAYKQYFFRQAFIDLKDITLENYELNKESILTIIEGTKDKLFSAETKTLITWPLGIAIFIAIPFAIILGGAVYLIVTAIHVLAVLLSASVIVMTAMVFRAIEYLNMARWRIFFACPSCYERFSMPVYSCPNCNAQHTKLVPGQYGIFKRKCECGNLLPTLFLNGKNKLPSKCPNCNHPLTAEAGVSINVHYPIVGGKSSGKSSFLVASMMVLSEKGKEEGYNLSFPEKRDKENFERFETNFKKGIPPIKTAREDKPRAFLVKLQQEGKKKPAHLIYMYDAAGEIFEDLDSLRHHKYFEYLSGIFFLIDPFSIPVIKQEYESELSKYYKNVLPSEEPPHTIYDRMIINLEQYRGQKKVLLQEGKYKIPIAVIITKSDAFDLQSKITSLNLELFNAEKNKIEEDIFSEQIRDWLSNNGEGNFVRSVESMFTNVKYFSCSALGHMPDAASDRPFTPKNVDAPIKWVFSFRKIFD